MSDERSEIQLFSLGEIESKEIGPRQVFIYDGKERTDERTGSPDATFGYLERMEMAASVYV